MSGLRLAFVTRRFWPLVGENELHLANLTEGLLQRGHQPTVVAPKYGKSWPNQVCVRGVPVVRLPFPTPRTWGNVRYSFAASRWLQQHRDQLDAVIVSGCPEDALTALGAVRGSPVAVIVQETLGFDIEPAPRRFGEPLLRRLRSCDAFVRFPKSDSSHAAETSPDWMTAEKVHQLALGVHPANPRTPQAREAARRALAEANPDLTTAADAPVALCLTPLISQAQLEQLARAWRIVQSRWQDSRLWVIGDGPTRGPLFTLLSDLNLKYRVVLPGTFDAWDDLLQAADLLIQPGQGMVASLAERQAMASGLPVIVFQSLQATSPLTVEAAASGFSEFGGVLHIHRDDGDQLASRLACLLEHPAVGVRIGEQGRRLAQDRFSFAPMLDDYEQLLQGVVTERRKLPGPA